MCTSRFHPSRLRARLRGDAGMSTAEYAVGTVAACAFAAVLYRVVTGGSKVSEATAFVTQKLSPATKLQAYVIAGFADGSPDRGVGLLFSASF